MAPSFRLPRERTIGTARFERAASASQTQRSNQAELRPAMDSVGAEEGAFASYSDSINDRSSASFSVRSSSRSPSAIRLSSSRTSGASSSGLNGFVT
jgi:hypothetical protein